MVSERIQRQIDRLLDQADDALTRFDWDSVRQCAEAVLAYDPENEDAGVHLSAVQRALVSEKSRTEPGLPAAPEPVKPVVTAPPPSVPQPNTFANGRKS